MRGKLPVNAKNKKERNRTKKPSLPENPTGIGLNVLFKKNGSW